jgi:large subunit ribosomal protein L9
MQIILLEKVGKLGNLGDVVKVKDGYARNYLIPTKQARRATEAAIKEFEARRADLEKAAAAKLAAARRWASSWRQDRAHRQKAGVDGRLFGSVTNADIAEALTKMGLAVAEGAGAHAQRPAEDRGRAHRCRWRRTPTWWSRSPCRWLRRPTDPTPRTRLNDPKAGSAGLRLSGAAHLSPHAPPTGFPQAGLPTGTRCFRLS